MSVDLLNKNGALLKIGGRIEGLIGPEGDAYSVWLDLLQYTPSFLAPVGCAGVEDVVEQLLQLDTRLLLSDPAVLAGVRAGLVRSCIA